MLERERHKGQSGAGFILEPDGRDWMELRGKNGEIPAVFRRTVEKLDGTIKQFD